jgi:hypothetical protein
MAATRARPEAGSYRAGMPPPGIHLDPDQVRRFGTCVEQQSGYLYGLVGYASDTCGETGGLDGFMSVLRGPVEDLAEMGTSVVSLCGTGLGPYVGAGQKIRAAVTSYQNTDAASATYINEIFPDLPVTIPSDVLLPEAGDAVFSYDNAEAPNPAEPTDDVTELTADEIDPGGVLGTFADVFEWAFGIDPLQELVEPFLGRFGRLAWLSTAHVNMGDAIYQVTWNLREGSYIVAPHFTGEAGTEFQVYMFRWHMGLGGLGDVYHVVSKLLADASSVIGDMTSTALDKLYDLIEWLAAKLAGVGWVRTGWNVVWSAVTEFDLTAVYDEIREKYDDVMALYHAIQDIKRKYDTLKAELEELWRTIQDVVGLASDPQQAIADAIDIHRDEVRDDAVEIEQMGVGAAQWPAETGALRVALLPLDSNTQLSGYY